MWYDLLVLAILGFFALRGAAKGLLNQLASIAAIVVCLVFAESFSAVFGPMIHLDPPLNHWVVMFGAYLACSFIAFGLARVLDDWLERAKLDSFNQHLGFLFGLAKGGILCLVMTFFLVTLSPAARSALSNSKSAYVAARVMNAIHPIMPARLQEALAKYLHISATGEAELPQQAGPTTVPGTSIPNVPAQAGSNSSIPSWTPNTPFPPLNGGGLSSIPSSGGVPAQSPPLIDTQRAIDLFVSQLPASVSGDFRNLIGWSLQNTPPEQRDQVQRQLWNIIYQSRPEDLHTLQAQLASRQPLTDAIAGWMSGFVAPRATTPASVAPASAPPSGYAPPNYTGYQPPVNSAPTYPQPANTPPAYSQPTYSQPTFAQPQYSQPTNSYAPPNGYASPASSGYGQPSQPYTPPPLMSGPQSQQDQLLAEISRAFSTIAPVQLQVQADIRQKLGGVPPEVSQSVLEDWRRDLWQPQSRDPDPTTDAGTTLEQRIVRQLQARGIPVNRLSSEVQDRLEGAALR